MKHRFGAGLAVLLLAAALAALLLSKRLPGLFGAPGAETTAAPLEQAQEAVAAINAAQQRTAEVLEELGP